MRRKHDKFMRKAHNLPMNAHELGQRIKALRQSRRYSQNRLASLVGVDQSQISRIENGEAGPSLETLSSIARVLNVGLSELTGDLDDQAGLENLTQEERELIGAFRTLSGDSRAALRRVAGALAEQAGGHPVKDCKCS